MRDVYLRRVRESDRFAFVLSSQDNVHRRQRRAHSNSEGPRVVPLVRAKVKIQDDLRSRRLRLLRSENGSTAGRLVAQAGSGELEHTTIRNGDGEDIINRELNVRAVVTVIDQWEFIRRLDPQHHGARSRARLARNETRSHTFFQQEIEDEI